MEDYERFEEEWARYGRLSNVVGCSSGTAALHLALEALRLPAGGEVLLPDFTMAACARAVILSGLVPRFIDCGRNLLLNPNLLHDLVSSRTVAVMPVHVYGRRCDMPAVIEFAQKYSLAVVEDLAEAHGVSPDPRSDAACWSFYRNKIIHGEEGGAVAFKDPKCAALARSLRCLGFTEAHDFTHVPRGHNYRLSNAHAALILKSLFAATRLLEARRLYETWLNEVCPLAWRLPPRNAPWVYDFRIPGLTSEVQSRIVKRLQSTGVCEGVRHGFKPMSSQEEFRQYTDSYWTGKEPDALVASREVLYLPLSYPQGFSEDRAEFVFDAILGELEKSQTC